MPGGGRMEHSPASVTFGHPPLRTFNHPAIAMSVSPYRRQTRCRGGGCGGEYHTLSSRVRKKKLAEGD